jgi:hypothetical protein
MGKAQRLSKNQKRKAKLKKKAKRAEASKSLAYRGSKYKNEELLPTFVDTEIAIYEAFVMADRRLTDQEVAEQLETMIHEMREEAPRATSEQDEEDMEDFLAVNIRSHWDSARTLVSRDNRIGILRSILSSISVWSRKSQHAQGYLRYLEEFMTKKIGIRVRKLSEVEDEDFDEEDFDDEDDYEGLYQAGREWLFDNDQDAKLDFKEMADSLIEDGGADIVLDVCEQLIKDEHRDAPNPELQALMRRARRIQNPF